MIVLIGGSARCGKSTLATTVAKNFSGQVLSLDDFYASLDAVATGRVRESLHPHPSIDTPVEEWISALRIRDRTLWDALKPYLIKATDNDEDVLVEGGLWPDFVHELAALAIPFRVVFLVDTSEDHIAHIHTLAHSTSTRNNWMADWSDEQLTKWAQYNIQRSKRIAELAQQYGYPVADLASSDYATAHSYAYTALQ